MTKNHLVLVARRAWFAPLTGKVLTALCILFIFLTIASLNQGRQLKEVRVVVREQQVVIRAQCGAGANDTEGCIRLTQRILNSMTPAQRASLRGPRGIVGPRGIAGLRGTAGPRGLTGSRGLTGQRGATGQRGEKPSRGNRG